MSKVIIVIIIIVIYLFIYLLIYLFVYLFIFAGCFSAFCFSAPDQNVSHDILNVKCTTLLVLAHIEPFLKSLLPLQSLRVVYLNFTVCIFNRIH